MPSGGTAALVGATSPVAQGGYVSDPAAWEALHASVRQQFERELTQAAAALNPASCVQTSALRVGVTTPPPAGARLVDEVSAGAPPAGCRTGPHGTTRCDTLFGFGAGSTPFTVTGQVAYSGTPVCVTYGAGQLCTGWFGAWGSDGTTDTGATGSGVGAETLAVAGAGDVRAQVSSSPSALYFSKAPSGDSTAVTVTPYVTLLDVTAQSVPDSVQCAPTRVAYGVVTPNVQKPALSSQELVSCVDEQQFDGRSDAASRASGPYGAVRAAQVALASATGATHAVQLLEAAGTASHRALASTSRAGLFGAGPRPPGSATVLAAACPVLNGALAFGTGPTDAFACTQSSIRPWKDVVLGQSVVSAQLTATAATETSGAQGEVHLLLALDTVDVHECWPAAACG
jgi:hypothetical protein